MEFNVFNEYQNAGTCHNWRSDNDGLMQERRNSIVNTLELRLSCTNPSIDILSRPRYSEQFCYDLLTIQNYMGCLYVSTHHSLIARNATVCTNVLWSSDYIFILIYGIYGKPCIFDDYACSAMYRADCNVSAGRAMCNPKKNMFLDISTDWSTRWIWGAVGTRIKIWLATSIKHQHQCPWNRDRLPMAYYNDASGSSAKQLLNFNGSLDNLPQ